MKYKIIKNKNFKLPDIKELKFSFYLSMLSMN